MRLPFDCAGPDTHTADRSMKKQRLDQVVVKRGLARSRQHAQALILAGKVFCNDRRVDKAGMALPSDARLELRGEDRSFVSRGGIKLAGALDALKLDVAGMRILDVGASTGGFCDCVLQRGAAAVVALDVGYGQLADALRRDRRVHVLERFNARHLRPQDLPWPPELVTVDASFIGLAKLLPALKAVLADRGRVLAMVKPQFELGPGHVGKGGVVRSPEARRRAVDQVAQSAQELGLVELARCESQLAGPKGNVETFLLLEPIGAAHSDS